MAFNTAWILLVIESYMYRIMFRGQLYHFSRRYWESSRRDAVNGYCFRLEHSKINHNGSIILRSGECAIYFNSILISIKIMIGQVALHKKKHYHLEKFYLLQETKFVTLDRSGQLNFSMNFFPPDSQGYD